VKRRLLPPTNGTRESEEAAEAVAPKAPAMRQAIVRLLRERPWLTCADIEAALRLKHQTVSARLWELSNERRVTYESRRGTNGRLVRHYSALDKGAP
jgi:predicted ArsR family transcriptional regulator